LGVLWIFFTRATLFFFQKITIHEDATFDGEKSHKPWAGYFKRPSSSGGFLDKNRPSLATYSHLNIIPKVARIDLNSSQSQVHCCVQERKSYVKRTIR
jgi:hypothetical protein